MDARAGLLREQRVSKLIPFQSHVGDLCRCVIDEEIVKSRTARGRLTTPLASMLHELATSSTPQFRHTQTSLRRRMARGTDIVENALHKWWHLDFRSWLNLDGDAGVWNAGASVTRVSAVLPPWSGLPTAARLRRGPSPLFCKQQS